MHSVPLISVVSRVESDYYNSEQKVLERGGTDPAIHAELEAQYGRIGGERDEHVKYLCRGCWRFIRISFTGCC